MNLLNFYDFINENNIDKWSIGSENTKMFDVSKECEKFLHNQKDYL